MNHPATVLRYAAAQLSGVLALCAAEGWTSYTEDPARTHAILTAPGVTTTTPSPASASIRS